MALPIDDVKQRCPMGEIRFTQLLDLTKNVGKAVSNGDGPILSNSVNAIGDE